MAEDKPADKQFVAAALAYRAGASAPTITAKGRGKVAEEIIRRAKESGVFVHESKEMVALLMELDLDQQIPPTLYRVVAELLAWIYRIENRLPATLTAPVGPKK
ncbi:MAG: EscU/YscU/HrcU family type III secretion system export apparatus switch protein [Pseudomonadota bacterium]